MPKVTEEYRVARRAEILEAAMRAFHRKGFQAASMADIIEESGLSAGAIYGHYASKADIVFAVASRVMGSRMDDVERMMKMDPMPPPAALVRVLMGGMLHDLGRPEMLVQLWGEAIAEPSVRELAMGVFVRLRTIYTHYISLWQQQNHGLSPADADALSLEQVNIFMSMAQGYIIQSALMPDFDGERYLEAVEKYLPR